MSVYLEKILNCYIILPSFKTAKGVTLFVSAHEGTNKHVVILSAKDYKQNTIGSIIVLKSKILACTNDIAFDVLWFYLRDHLFNAADAEVTVGVI